MLSLPPPALVVLGVLATACAQILLKKAAGHAFSTPPWYAYMAVSALFYAGSFLAYSFALKYYALNKIYPAMTVAQIVLITLYGLWIGEVIDARHALGLALGVVAIYLILS
ncbi:MAG: hypothetical protein NZ524_02530 [Thiobacillaceae bacterium]|nr:hypothetical protein [Thiobacillaceae bacterium]MDW8322992.1 hypothetical protein [Burkholderiales bacterium]